MWVLGLYSPFLDWFRLISIGMAKNEFCNNKGIFFLSIKFNVIKQRIYFDFSFAPSFLPFPFNPFFFLLISSFVAHFIVFLLRGIVAG